MLPVLDSAGLSGRFVPAYLSLEIQSGGHPLSNLRLYHLPHVSYLSDEACTLAVQIDCYLFTESSSCRRSFFDWATPVKLCSIVIFMLVDCLVHQLLSSIPISNASRQRAEKAGGQRASWPVGYLAY